MPDKRHCISYIEGSFGELGYHDVKITYELDYDFGGKPIISFVKAELLIDGRWTDILPLLRPKTLIDYEQVIKVELEELKNNKGENNEE